MVSLFLIMLQNRSPFSSFNNASDLEADNKNVLHMKHTGELSISEKMKKAHPLHRQIAHPPKEKLIKLLKKANTLKTKSS